ncbi:MAG: protoporphyrinogen oxidase HemJ [Pseudomonadota bacterium]
MDNPYLWVKAAHIVAMTAWMAGLFYLPRLYVYHAENGLTGPKAEMLQVMERKLLKLIMNPAMLATWVLGIALVLMNPGWLEAGWIHAKITLVVLMSGFQGACGKWRKELAAGTSTKTGKFFRIANEVPTVLLILIVVLVVVQPF